MQNFSLRYNYVGSLSLEVDGTEGTIVDVYRDVRRIPGTVGPD